MDQNNKSLHRILLILLLSAAARLVAQSNPYIVLENPADFIIQDRYQQNLSPAHPLLSAQFVPFRILEENLLMSDQIHLAIHCQLADKRYYIFQDTDGAPIARNSNAAFQRYTKAQSLEDTIRITEAGQIGFAPGLKVTRSQRKLKIGQIARRIFRSGMYYYLRLPDNQFGWSALTPKSAWQIIIRADVRQTDIPDHLRNRIEDRIRKANRRYQRIFTHLNEKSNQSRPVPSWQISGTDQVIHIRFKPIEYLQHFPESTSYFFRDLENILLGQDFFASFQDSMIVIKAESP